MFKLTVNCRNTKEICLETQAITGDKGTIKILNNLQGLPVSYNTYGTNEEQKKKLIALIKHLLNNRINRSRITILSPYTRNKSVVSLIDHFTIKNYSVRNDDSITFCTIQSFKGLENDIIIIVDVESFDQLKLLYVGYSRARLALHVFESLAAYRQYIEIQKRRFGYGQQERADH
jgi:DNA helicase IV